MFALKDRYGTTMFGATLNIIIVIVVLLALVFAACVAISYYSCNSYMELNQDYELQWDFWNGCMVKSTQGLWIRSNQIDFIQGELKHSGN